MIRGAIVAIGGGNIPHCWPEVDDEEMELCLTHFAGGTTKVASRKGATVYRYRPKEPDTKPIDLTTIKLACERMQHAGKPRVLYLPTASYDDRIRVEDMRDYLTSLGCEFKPLLLKSKQYTPERLAWLMSWADIIYVGGGNTRYLMKMWERHGLIPLLKKAYERGAVLTGKSAGSICWFKGGWSDAEQDEGFNPWYPVWVEGLGLIDVGHSPHFQTDWRQKKTAEGPEGTTIALDDYAALIVADGQYTVMSCEPKALAFRCQVKDGEYTQVVLPDGKSGSLESIL